MAGSTILLTLAMPLAGALTLILTAFWSGRP